MSPPVPGGPPSTAGPAPSPPGRAANVFYYPGLDGLRFLAFLAVFAFHVGVESGQDLGTAALPWYAPLWWLRNGELAGGFGVDLFFVLSSFLITSLLLREADLRGRLDVRAFWVRRILRIWPLYFAFLLTATTIEGTPWPYVVSYGLFAGNWGNILYGIPHDVILPLWSVSVEEQFYLAWPLVLVLVPRRRLALACAGMIALSLANRVGVWWVGAGHGPFWYNTFGRLDPIALGALIALWWRARPLGLPGRVRLGLAVAALVPLPVLAYRLVPLPFRADVVVIPLAVALACGALLVVALAGPASLLAHPALAYLGRISYGLYVFHLVGLRLGVTLWWPWQALLGFAFTVLAAALSYRFLEQPFLRLKDRFTWIPSGAAGAAGRG